MQHAAVVVNTAACSSSLLIHRAVVVNAVVANTYSSIAAVFVNAVVVNTCSSSWQCSSC